MAAPIVTGTIALMKSIKKDITVSQARNALYKTGADVYGYIPPMVLVDKALVAVKNGDFSEPSARKIKPIPDGKEVDSSAGRAADVGQVPTPPIPSHHFCLIYFYVFRRKRAENKKKIEQLEKLLPNKR